MYNQFFGFKEKPFSLLPDPDFLFLSEKHGAALDLLELAVLNQSGFCLLSGEIGAGKTTLIRELLNRVSNNLQVGLVSNTHPSFGELMQWIMVAYGLECKTTDRLALHKQFIDYVIDGYGEGKRTLLIVDEAQNLSSAALEELRMLSNVNSDKDLVLQVMLVGQQQLREKLQQPQLTQFVQRIGVEFHLSALDEAETSKYIRHRIIRAGGRTELFSDAACQVVYRSSRGVPRLINRICDLALVYAFSEGSALVDAAMVNTVVDDQQIGNVLEAARTCKEANHHAYVHTGEPAPGIRQPGIPRSGVADPLSADAVESVAPSAAAVRPVRRVTVTAEPSISTDTPRPSASSVPGESEKPSELHRMVVDAEGKIAVGGGSGRRRRGSLLSLALAAGVGSLVAIGWFSRDIWSGWEVSDWYHTVHARLLSPGAVPDTAIAPERPPQPLARLPETALETPTDVERDQPVKETGTVDVAVPMSVSVKTDETSASITEENTVQAAETGREVVHPESEHVAIQKTNEVTLSVTAVADDELKRESERLATLQENAARLERERHAAERELAQQLKARLALEKKAHEERERMLEAQAAVKQIAAERARAERARLSAQVHEPEPNPGLDRESVKPAVSEIIAETNPSPSFAVQQGTPFQAPFASQATESTAVSPLETSFQANPCDGPIAKFMSTCSQRKP